MSSASGFLLVTYFLLGAIAARASSFDWTFANLTVQHSQNTYCDPDTYITRDNKGILEGFVVTQVIEDSSHDTHGYVGYDFSRNAVIVAFRGSETPTNFMDDMKVNFIEYPACQECQVHSGFYMAELSVINSVENEVLSLLEKYPSFTVVITGHSLGAALGTLIALDLIDNPEVSSEAVRLFTFGSPRVGNMQFAIFASNAIPHHTRVTHHRDMVPHFPSHFRYMHLDGEWYQPDDDLLVVGCTGYEDEKCSYQWSGLSTDDHMHYLGVSFGVSHCDQYLE